MPCHTRMKSVFLQGLLWLFLLQLGFMAGSLEPGYLDFDNLPDTNFSCIGRVVGGYYADIATACQMFHVCTLGQNNETMDIRFLCLNGTVFEQSTRVCERIDEVDCEKSEQYYHLNNELYGGMDPLIIRGESGPLEPLTTPSTTSSTSSTIATTTTANPYFGTTKQTTSRQNIPVHHLKSDSPADIRFDPKIINLELNSDPSLGAKIKPISYQQQSYNDDKSHHTIVTTHSYKSDIPKTLYDNFKSQNLKPTDINYEFEYQDQEQYHPANRNNYLHGSNIPNYSPPEAHLDDYADDIYKGSTYRTIYHTPSNKPAVASDSSTYKTSIIFTSSVNPQSLYSPERTEVPVKQQVTPPPSIYSSLSSPAPFTHQHHLEAKRNTDHHKIKKSFSLSISDQNGKELIKVNNTPISAIFPNSYVDYKDDEATLLPIFEDVPRLNKRRQRRSTEKKKVFKADPEAADVLRFLLDWYTNYEKTTKISIPLTSEAITEINDELGSTKEKNKNNLYNEEGEETSKNDVSDLKKRENDYYDEYYYYESEEEDPTGNNSSNITVSHKELVTENGALNENSSEASKNKTESEILREAIKENIKNFTDDYFDEYVDDNYEPLTYKNDSDLNKTETDVNEIPRDITTLSPDIYDEYVDDNYEALTYTNISESGQNSTEKDAKTTPSLESTTSTQSKFNDILDYENNSTSIEGNEKYFTTDTSILKTTIEELNNTTETEIGIEITNKKEEQVLIPVENATLKDHIIETIEEQEEEEKEEEGEEGKEEDGVSLDEQFVTLPLTTDFTTMPTTTTSPPVSYFPSSSSFTTSPPITSTASAITSPSTTIFSAIPITDSFSTTTIPSTTSLEPVTLSSTISSTTVTTAAPITLTTALKSPKTHTTAYENQEDNVLESITAENEMITVLESTTSQYSTQLSTEQINTAYTDIYDSTDSVLLALGKTTNLEEVPITSTDNTSESLEVASETTHVTQKTITTTNIPKVVKENLQEIIKDIEVETKSVAATVLTTKDKKNKSKSDTLKLENSVTDYLETNTTVPTVATTEASITTTYLPTISVTTPKLTESTTRFYLSRGRNSYFSRLTPPPIRKESTHRFNIQQRRRYDRRKPFNRDSERKTISSSVNDVNIDRLNVTRNQNNITVSSRSSGGSGIDNNAPSTESLIKKERNDSSEDQKIYQETITDASLSKSANPTLAKESKDTFSTTPISKYVRTKLKKERINKKYIFTCFDKKLNKFYSDPRDCRLFHYCSQGYTRNQFVDMKFVCDLGTYFDDIKLICTEDKPARCL